jgi:N-acetylneuraminic acid mutarotase
MLYSFTADKWIWSKPLIHGSKENKPLGRAEHSACKTGTNEVTIFGGWTTKPTNEMWTFDVVNMEWRVTVSSGIQPRPRYRHTAEVVGTNMYIFGGSDNSDDVAATGGRHLGIHELSLETMQWSHPSLKGADPFPRSGHGSAVIGAQSVAIFGGKRSNDVSQLFRDIEVPYIEYFRPLKCISSNKYNHCFVSLSFHMPVLKYDNWW